MREGEVLGLLLILSAFGNLGHCPRLVFSTGGAGERELALDFSGQDAPVPLSFRLRGSLWGGRRLPFLRFLPLLVRG